MSDNRFSRTELLLGDGALERLLASRVAVFGVGGVGGYVVEALARSGIGALDLIDKDDVDITNINRQIIADTETVGRPKVEVFRERIGRISPECQVTAYQIFYLPETADQFDFSQYDYVVDAVDTVTAKMSIIERAREAGVPVISAMGAGNKLDPTRFEVADIYETSVCPLARVIRRECKQRGIDHLKVVYSKEQPLSARAETDEPDRKKEASADGHTGGFVKATPGSVSFVPSVMGLIIAGEVIKDLSRPR